jgi:hypothetical protein
MIDQKDEPLGQVAAHPRLVHVSQGTYKSDNPHPPAHLNPRTHRKPQYTRLSITSQLESSET